MALLPGVDLRALELPDFWLRSGPGVIVIVMKVDRSPHGSKSRRRCSIAPVLLSALLPAAVAMAGAADTGVRS